MLFFWRRQIQVVPKKNTSETIMFEYDDGITRKSYDFDSLERTNHLPRSIYCPITKMPMVDPVLAVDGYSYEREKIQDWFKKKDRSPVTNKKINNRILIPNHSLRTTISELLLH